MQHRKCQMVDDVGLQKTLKAGLFPQFHLVQADVQRNLNFSVHPEGRSRQEPRWNVKTS